MVAAAKPPIQPHLQHKSPKQYSQLPSAQADPVQALLAAAKKLSQMSSSRTIPQPQGVTPENAHTTGEKGQTAAQPSSVVRKPSYKASIITLTPQNLKAVDMPMFYPRDSNRSHVDQLKSSIMREGIDDETGFIAFCTHFGSRHVVRGARVLQAFNELYDEGCIRYITQEDAVSPLEHRRRIGLHSGVLYVDKVKCVVLDRVDENGTALETPFTATETLLLAAHYNSKNGHIRPMTMHDNITLAQRFILCRLRDLHLSDHIESTRRRTTPPNVIWSKLPQFVAEATSCNLIPYSNTPSAPHCAEINNNSSGTNDHSTMSRQLIRAVRQRQAEYLRLAMSLLWSPHTQNLIMNRHYFETKPISCSLWSLRTFRLRPFTSADDTVQFVMLIALYRCHQERRALNLRPFDRDKTKQFLGVVERCMEKLVSWTSNRSKAPFPTKWDVLNGVTVTTVSSPTDSGQPNGKDQQQEQRVTIASIMMSLLTRWEHTSGRSVNSMPHPDGCTTNDILFSLQRFTNNWPFNRKWRMLSPSLPCFQPDLFLQPLLPLSSVRLCTLPITATPQNSPLLRPDSASAPMLPAQRPTTRKSSTMVHTTAVSACAPSLCENPSTLPPPPIKLARLLPAIDDRMPPVPPSQTDPVAQTTLDSYLSLKQITIVAPPKLLSTPSSIAPLAPGAAPSAAKRPCHSPRMVDEETLEFGHGQSILNSSEDDDERTDPDGVAEPIALNGAASTDKDPVEAENNEPESHVQNLNALRKCRTSSAPQKRKAIASRKHSQPLPKRNRSATRRNLNETCEQFSAEQCDENLGENIDDGRNEEQDDDGDFMSIDEDLEPMYDKISAKLPPSTGAQNLPTPCHDLGAWGNYITDTEMSKLSETARERCAIMYYTELYGGSDFSNQDLWPRNIGQKAYCELKRTELHTNGYTIMRGVLEGTQVASDGDCVIKHFARMWQGEKKMTQRQQEQSVWRHIFNCGSTKDPKYAKEGVGRYTVGVVDLVDRTIREHGSIFKKRLCVEALLGVLIDDVIADTNKESPLRFPVTGSRLIFQTRHALPQLPHYDFRNVEYEDGSTPWRPGCDDLSYFAMVSAAEGFHLRIWKDGHRMLYGPFDLVKKIAETLQSEVLYVPPYSVLIVRGDLPHAGVGGEEADGPRCLSPDDVMHIRFHIYVARNFERLKDGVYVSHHKLKINDHSARPDRGSSLPCE